MAIIGEYKPTHRELVQRAGKWLLARNYYTVLMERKTFTQEDPDAIGWSADGRSAVVEVKVSRSDFLADLKKIHRNSCNSFGHKRYYMCPKGLIMPDELPKGWGLVYASEYSTRLSVDSEEHTRSLRSLELELSFLARTYRKLSIGVMVVPESNLEPDVVES